MKAVPLLLTTMLLIPFCGLGIAQTVPPPPSAPALSAEAIAKAEANKTGHHFEQTDYSGTFATNLFSGQHVRSSPTIDVYMPDTWIWNESQYAKYQYHPYTPDKIDASNTLKIIAAGMTLNSGACVSVDRIALLSGKAGKVVVEATSSEPIGYVLQNGFGAKSKCSDLLAAFPMDGVRRLRAASHNGEFIVAVFFANGNRKLYTIKHGDQKKLGLPGSKG